MKIREAIQYGHQQLSSVGDTARLDSELILCKIFNRRRTFLYSHPDEILDLEKVEQFQGFLNLRQQSIPMAYILGEKEFWSMSFKVCSNTLIPRPATEAIIEYILNLHLPEDSKVCDLGTGSGAIAICLAKENPSWKITATDIQANALAMAAHNGQHHHCINIKFIWSNWFQRLNTQKYHLIVSNPPYIHPDAPHLLKDDVQHEPRLALASEDKGFLDLKRIIEQAQNYLYPQGFLILEHGYDQQTQVIELLKNFGYQNVQGFQDYEALPRFCVGQKHA